MQLLSATRERICARQLTCTTASATSASWTRTRIRVFFFFDCVRRSTCMLMIGSALFAVGLGTIALQPMPTSQPEAVLHQTVIAQRPLRKLCLYHQLRRDAHFNLSTSTLVSSLVSKWCLSPNSRIQRVVAHSASSKQIMVPTFRVNPSSVRV